VQLRHIEACHAVFRTGAIARAAKLLGISQPAASKLIKHAEQQLGFRLFERIKGRLVPTREAELLAPEVEKVFRQLDQLRRLEQNLVPSQEVRLRIGTIPSLGLSILPRAIRLFQQRHPALRYKIHVQHTSELIQSLMSQDLDLGFTFNAEPHVGIGLERLARAELVYVRKGGGGREIQLSDIDSDTSIGLMEDDPIGRLLYRKLHNEKIAFAPPPIEVQSYYIACALAERGCGSAIVDTFTAQALKGRETSIARIRPSISFDVMALRNELRVLPRYCDEFVKCFRDVCRVYAKSGTD
jgi:DNA-binding transcriptional LysR family regulator